MKTTNWASLLLVVVLLLGLLCGSAMGEAAVPFSVTDMTGREVEFTAPVTKIVALTPSDCEILFALGAGDMLVGRGSYCDYPAEVLEAPVVQSGADTNIEQIIALGAQVVLMNTMAQTKEQVAALENAGIRVVVSDAVDIAGVYESIALIGAVAAKAPEAEALAADMKASFALLGETAGSGKTVYFEVSPLEWGLWTAGAGTFMDELAAMLGLKNAFADVQGWGEVSQEQVLERDPDYIVTIAMYFGEGPTPIEEIIGREGWQGLKAVQNNAILNADSNEISRPGPRLMEAIHTLYEFISQAEEEIPAA